MAYGIHNFKVALEAGHEINFEVTGYTLTGGMSAFIRIQKAGSSEYFKLALTLSHPNVTGSIAFEETGTGHLSYNQLGPGAHTYSINILGGLGNTLLKVQGGYTIAPVTGTAGDMSTLIETLAVTTDAHSRITSCVVGTTPPDTTYYVTHTSGATVADEVALYSDTTGKVIKSSGTTLADNVTHPTGATVAEQLPVYSGTTGKIVKTSGVTFPTATPAKGQLLAPSSATALGLVEVPATFGGRYHIATVPETVTTVVAADTWYEYVSANASSSGLYNATFSTGTGRFTVDYTTAPPTDSLCVDMTAHAVISTTAESRTIDMAAGGAGAVVADADDKLARITTASDDASVHKYSLSFHLAGVANINEADTFSLFFRSSDAGDFVVEQLWFAIWGHVDARELLLA